MRLYAPLHPWIPAFAGMTIQGVGAFFGVERSLTLPGKPVSGIPFLPFAQHPLY